MTHKPPPYPASADMFGTPVEAGDHIVPLGRPLHPALVVAAGAGVLTVQAGGERTEILARHTRVVTVRDAHGRRLGDGDIVRGVDQAAADDVTYVISRIHYAIGMVTVAGPTGTAGTVVTLPALLVRVGAAVSAGDQVIDGAGTLCVVLEDRGARLLIEPLVGDAPAGERDRGELRRALEAHPGLHVAADGSFTVPALDGDGLAAADVDAILAGTWAPNVVPLPRAAG